MEMTSPTQLAAIVDAAAALEPVVHRTPVMTSTAIDRLAQCSCFFKCESFQRAGAFKFRGAYNWLRQLTAEERDRGVVTHSSGNHAQALALAGALLAIKTTVVVPRGAPSVKVAATRGYGAEVVSCAPTLRDRTETCERLIAEHGFTLVHPYNHLRIVHGAGTAALELCRDIPGLDAVVAPVGGGGLLSGTALAAKGISPSVKVYGAEPKAADDAWRSLQAGRIIDSDNPQTLADGLRTSLGDVTFGVIREAVDDIITVDEDEIVAAMRLLWERMKLVVEPSGAVALAAVVRAGETLRGRRVGVILSGGNVDPGPLFAHLTLFGTAPG